MNTKINLTESNHRMQLLSAVELAMKAYSHPIGDDMFVFEDPLSENLIKVHHVSHYKDNRTQKLLHDYLGLRNIILNDTEWRFNRRHCAELAVAIENYLRILHGKISQRNLVEFNKLDKIFNVSLGGQA